MELTSLFPVQKIFTFLFIPFTINIDDFKELIQKKCYYCGCDPYSIQKTRHYRFVYNGLDKKNCNLGYTLDNVVTCCKDCNYAKWTQSPNEFIEKISLIYKKHIWKPEIIKQK